MLDLGEESEVEFYQRILREQNLKDRDAMRIFSHALFILFEINQELIAYIRQSRAHLKLDVFSNFSGLLPSLMMNIWRLVDLFDALVISSEVKFLKPKSRIHLLNIEKMA